MFFCNKRTCVTAQKDCAAHTHHAAHAVRRRHIGPYRNIYAHVMHCNGLIDSYSDGRGCEDDAAQGEKGPVRWTICLQHHSPYTREQCVTQWCCQRNQTPFLLHWRRSKSYRHRPPGCPWAGSPVCRQSQQKLGLKEKQREQYCQPTVYEILPSRERRPYSLWHQRTKWKIQLHQGLAGKHFASTSFLMVSKFLIIRRYNEKRPKTRTLQPVEWVFCF